MRECHGSPPLRRRAGHSEQAQFFTTVEEKVSLSHILSLIHLQRKSCVANVHTQIQNHKVDESEYLTQQTLFFFKSSVLLKVSTSSQSESVVFVIICEKKTHELPLISIWRQYVAWFPKWGARHPKGPSEGGKATYFNWN